MDSLEELNRHIAMITHEHNNRANPGFEGYSPAEMRYILYDVFGTKSPVQLNKLPEADYSSVPILMLIKYLLQIISESKELKLTNKGFLPTKVVADIYKQGFIKEEFIESGIYKLYKETDSMSINLARILCDISGLTKKRYNKLSLTKTGEKLISDNHELLKLIFTIFGSKFNWAYYDGYGENHIGQLGFGFSLILLGKYGNEKRLDRFYSEKYFKAFPALIDNIEPPRYGTVKDQAARCYSIRTFDRFLDYFGIIKIESEKIWDADKFVIKTELFDKMIRIKRHKIFQ